MAEKRKQRRRREEPDEKILPEEYAVAKYLKKKLPSKEAMLFNHKVNYFIASKAVDVLLDSPWATAKKSQEALFSSRQSIIEFLNTLLHHKFFHRARKIVISKDIKKKKKKDESGDEKEVKKKKNEKEKSEDKKDKKEDEEKKKKKRFKLDMHLDQSFVDGKEVYVWIYDPVPTKAWFIGGLLVVGAVLLCLFPLWPQSCRKGVYYLSIAAAGFLVVILALAISRVIVFCIVWLFSLGKRHLWLLPNLTEDVGFVDSFWPLYKYEYRGGDTPTDKDHDKDKKSEKDKDDKSHKKNMKSKDDSTEEEKAETVIEDQDTEDQVDTEEQVDDNDFEVLEPTEDDYEGNSDVRTGNSGDSN
ncbi:Translocation protein S62 [Chamberlinius hualienensis]